MDDSKEIYLLLDKVISLRPATALDVGCGRGEMTVRLSPFCGQITAIDLSGKLIACCKIENQRTNIAYLCMDGRKMTFDNGAFEMVLECNSLHHVEEWEKMLAEMVRVSSRQVLIEEPVDDLRNDAKRATARVQDLMLEVQKEAGYTHFKHLRIEDIMGVLERAPLKIQYDILKRDDPTEFEEFETPFRYFAERSGREAYWIDRFIRLKNELVGTNLCHNDKILISAIKET